MSEPRISLYSETAADLNATLEFAKDNKYKSIVSNIVSPCYEREFMKKDLADKHQRFTRSALVLPASTWYSKVIVKINIEQLNLDSTNALLRRQSEEALKQELNLTEHLMSASGLTLIKLPMFTRTQNLARTLLCVYHGIILLEVPMGNPLDASLSRRSDREPGDEDPWNSWNDFRCHSDFNPKLKLALEVTADIPSDQEIFRWCGEPVDTLIVPASIFISNANNYPVLSKGHQRMLQMFLSTIQVNFIVKPDSPQDNRIPLYYDYIRHLYQKNYIYDPLAGYTDFLEIPLQPLYDNLDTGTYEVFEKDPVKYIFYQQAIEQVLIDKVSEDEIKDKTTIIMVVGAGRGPLVRATLNAARNTGRKAKIYVVEKNPNAILTLSALLDEMWKDEDITLISRDMRELELPEKADVLVSELLGSFGDNELSPECLDGAQKLLKDDGVSIPSRSTSFVKPTMSSKIYNAIKMLERTTHQHSDKQIQYTKHDELSYVVYMKNVFHLDDAQVLFEFEHPNRSTKPIDNTRCKTLKFTAKLDAMLHGFSGFFDAVLYKDIKLSILPETHSQGLASWFPMFFPITAPQFVKAGQEIEVCFWRNVGEKQVWYEWKVESPQVTHSHNLGGRSFPIYM